MLFNVFINDLIGFIKKPWLYNFADDNTITTFEKDITLFKKNLQNEAEIETQWLKENFMNVNPGKFQAVVIDRFGKKENKQEMVIEYQKITSEHSVWLLGIEIDNQLNFDNHVSKLCKKAGFQLNGIGRLKNNVGFPEKKCFDRSLCIHEIYKQNRVNTKKALRLLYVYYTSTFDSLLARANKPSMKLKRYQTLRWRFLKQ